MHSTNDRYALCWGLASLGFITWVKKVLLVYREGRCFGEAVADGVAAGEAYHGSS